MRDYVGRFVRLTREITTNAGGRFAAGTIMRCARVSRGLVLSLPQPLASCPTRLIKRVRPFEVDLVTGRHCKVCGCTDADCRGCIERTGEPCTWAGPNLCSACVS